MISKIIHGLGRFYNFVYALLGGFFWLRCPICKEGFGGHEYDGGSLMTSWTTSILVCRNCKSEAIKRNIAFMSSSKPPKGILLFTTEDIKQPR